MIAVRPSSNFEAVIDTGETGLFGTIGLRANDNLGNTVIAFDFANIVEIAFGVYAAHARTAPATVGQYTLIWTRGSGGEVLGTEDLLVTGESDLIVVGEGHDYISSDQLKASLSMQGQTFADEDISIAKSTASRVVDDITERRFWADDDATQIRYYTPRSLYRVDIDDLITLTAVDVDRNRDGVFETALTLHTHFELEPLNAAADDRPFEQLVFTAAGQSRIYGCSGRSIRVTGRFGWPALPAEVQSITKLLATRYLNRQRGSAVFGMVTAGQDSAAIARIARSDPDVMNALSRVTRTRAMIR